MITTDPVPEPAAKTLGADGDYYWRGWLSVTINASDLAAAGADPIGFLAAIEAPPTFAIADMERLLQGISDACAAEGLQYAGGNLKEGDAVRVTGTALGWCPGRHPVRRAGAKPSDFVVSVGQGGVFWRDALALTAGLAVVDKGASPVFRPMSQLRCMRLLAVSGVASAAIDNSDGLIPTLSQMAAANSMGIEIDLSRLQVPQLPLGLGVDGSRLWLGWGDWNVVAAIAPERFEDAELLASSVGTPLIHIGNFVQELEGVVLARNGKTSKAPRLESEQFSKDSWFTSGIAGYIRGLLDAPLP